MNCYEKCCPHNGYFFKAKVELNVVDALRFGFYPQRNGRTKAELSKDTFKIIELPFITLSILFACYNYWFKSLC